MEPGLSSPETRLRRGRPALWQEKYGLLRPRKQQCEQLGSAFAVNDPVYQVWAEAPLEGNYGFLRLCDVVTETLERQKKAGVGPEGIDQVARRARQCQAPLGKRMPGKQLARILLARRSDVGMADHIAAADPVSLLDVGNERDQRGDLLVGEFTITELMAGIDDLDPDARRVDVRNAAPTRFSRVPGALGLIVQPVNRAVLVDQVMGRDCGLRGSEAIERTGGVRHSGIMEDDHRYR